MENTTPDRVSLKEKLGYGIGDFGANLVFQTITLYLMYFFTDVFLISASAAGIVSFISKLWDGITDPLMGYLSDRTNTRWGSKRPWLLFGVLPLGIAFFLLFSSPPLGDTGRIIYALVLFLTLNTFYTVVNVPYGAMTAAMTLSASERSSITGYRMFFAIVATLFVAGATKPLVGLFPDEQTGFRGTIAIYGILTILFTLVTVVSVKEKYGSTGEGDFTLGDIKRIILSNRPFLFLSIGTVLHLASVAIVASMLNYYFKYVIGREDFIPIAFLCLLGSAVAALPVWVLISNRFGKKKAFNTGMLIMAVSLLPWYFPGFTSIPLLVTLLITGGAGMSTIYLSPWAMVPDTVEYSQWKTGLRREGILYGFFYFGQKLSAGTALLVSGVGLQLSGYVQPKGQAVVQSASALAGIRTLTGLIPVILILAGAYFISRYPITREMHEGIVRDLKLKEEGLRNE